MRKKIFQTVIVLTLLAVAVGRAYAYAAPALAAVTQDSLWGAGTRNYIQTNSGLPTQVTDPRQLAVNIINIVLGFLGILAVILILYAGFRWMTAGGNEENVAAAKKILIAGIIGLVIILASYALANFVINQLIGATTGTPAPTI